MLEYSSYDEAGPTHIVNSIEGSYGSDDMRVYTVKENQFRISNSLAYDHFSDIGQFERVELTYNFMLYGWQSDNNDVGFDITKKPVLTFTVDPKDFAVLAVPILEKFFFTTGFAHFGVRVALQRLVKGAFNRLPNITINLWDNERTIEQATFSLLMLASISRTIFRTRYIGMEHSLGSSFSILTSDEEAESQQ